MKISDKTELGRTGLKISRIVYGGIISTQERQQDSDRYVDHAISHGINYFDVAPSYGNAQEIMGNSIKDKRKDIFLACKTGEFEIESGKKEFYESLKLLHTDYFDVYQLHGLTNFGQLERAFDSNGIMGFLVKAKKEGIIRNIGFSSHNEKIALKALDLYDFDTVMFPFNWSMNISMKAGDDLLTEAKKRNLGILGLKTLADRAITEDEKVRFPKSWYKPIDLTDIDFIRAAVSYTFSIGVHAIVPPGYFEYLKLLIDDFGYFADQEYFVKSKEYLGVRINSRENEILPDILKFD